jgi:CyaY protein
MNESEFRDLADQTIESIQTAIDDSGMDIDYEESGGVLTLEFENGSKIIFSKQPPVKQLWMAAKSGGFHFDYDESAQQWMLDSGEREELYAMLSRLATEQSGEAVSLTAPGL